MYFIFYEFTNADKYYLIKKIFKDFCKHFNSSYTIRHRHAMSD